MTCLLYMCCLSCPLLIPPQKLIIRAYRWYRVRRWARETGRAVRKARQTLQRNFNYYRQRLRYSLRGRMAAARLIQGFFRARKERKRLEYVRREWKIVFRDRVRRAVVVLQGAARMWPLYRRWQAYKWAVPRIQVARVGFRLRASGCCVALSPTLRI